MQMVIIYPNSMLNSGRYLSANKSETKSMKLLIERHPPSVDAAPWGNLTERAFSCKFPLLLRQVTV